VTQNVKTNIPIYYKKIAYLCLLFSIETNFAEQTKNIDKITSQNIIIDSPSLEKSRVPKFIGMDTSFLQKIFTEETIQQYKETIEKCNPYHTNIWQRKLWDIDYYKENNLPIVVGVIQDTQKFSSQHKDVGLRFLDLPLYMPNQGWRIPTELEQFKEIIKMAVDHERFCVHDFEKDHYVYITIDQGWVAPQTSQRRAGWHGDSYRKIDSHKPSPIVLVDHVYVAYDNCPTLFLEGPFSLDKIDPENVSEVLELFMTTSQHKKPITYPSYTVLRLDPYCVHDAGINTSNAPVFRTFVKISFSKIKYAHLGNAHNNLFVYDWPMTPRKKVPYTKEAISLSAHRKDRDQFIEIDTSSIDFLHKKSVVPWADSRVYTCYKKGRVYAVPAQEGDLLESQHDEFLITINVAQKDDYKVTFDQNDCGFINAKKFHELHSPDLNYKNWFFHKKILRRAVQLTQNVRLKAPWGTIQYACTGDYLIYVNEEDIYFVPKKLFEETFEILD